MEQGDYTRSIADLKRAIQLNGPAEAYADLAIILSACPRDSMRNAKQAQDHARKACEMTSSKDWRSLAALANALAESGNVQEAQGIMVSAVALVANRVPAELEAWSKQVAEGRPFRLVERSP